MSKPETSTQDPKPSRAGFLTPAILVALGAIFLVGVVFVCWYLYQLSDAGRRIPQASANLDLAETESITTFVPAGATLLSSQTLLATRGMLGNSDSKSGIVRRFDTSDVAATMTAFVEPATTDGWELVDVDCQRVLDTSEMSYLKAAHHSDGTPATLDLDVSYDKLTGNVVADMRVSDLTSSAQEPRPIDALLYTGVSRSDPGCLRDHREPPPAPPGPAWTSAQTCAVVSAAWPDAVVEPSLSEYCGVSGPYQFNIKAVATTDPYEFEDKRLSTAGGPTMFATTDGGFWVARPDGIALYGVSPSGSIGTSEGVLPEDEILRLASQLAAAPGPG